MSLRICVCMDIDTCVYVYVHVYRLRVCGKPSISEFLSDTCPRNPIYPVYAIHISLYIYIYIQLTQTDMQIHTYLIRTAISIMSTSRGVIYNLSQASFPPFSFSLSLFLSTLLSVFLPLFLSIYLSFFISSIFLSIVYLKECRERPSSKGLKSLGGRRRGVSLKDKQACREGRRAVMLSCISE